MSRRVLRSKKQGALAELKRQKIAEALMSSDGSESSDEVPINLLLFMAANASKKKKKTPKKKKKAPSTANFLNDLANRRHWHSETGCPCMMAQANPSTSRPRKTRTSQKSKSTARPKEVLPSTSTLHMDLLSDDEKKTSISIPDQQVDNIKSKLNSFFQVIESSDDEEAESRLELKLNVNSNKETQPVREKTFYEMPLDSDNDIDNSLETPDINCGASTSAEKSTTFKESSFTITEKIPEKKSKNGDLMAMVDDIIRDDDVVDVCEVEQKKNHAQLLEDYKKKTEDMLSSVASIIDGFCKNPEDKKEEEDKSQETKSCPVCLENVGAERPAMATFCGHIFCEECITHVARTTKKCPTCRKTVGLKKIHPVYL